MRRTPGIPRSRDRQAARGQRCFRPPRASTLVAAAAAAAAAAATVGQLTTVRSSLQVLDLSLANGRAWAVLSSSGGRQQGCLRQAATLGCQAPSAQIGLRATAAQVAEPGTTLAEEPALLRNAVRVDVSVLPGVEVHVLEASLDWQDALVNQALDAPDGTFEADPYGVVLWPAAQVLAQAVASHIAAFGPLRIMELGAGCGLASLTALKLGADVLATDFRELPLQLLEEAATQQGLRSGLRTQVFDICGDDPLPEADLVIASDVLYERRTAKGLARRVNEARRRGSKVLISDTGRPGRPAFVEALGRLLEGGEDEGAQFVTRRGVAVQGSRHELFCEPARRPPPGQQVGVDLLELPMPFAHARREGDAARYVEPLRAEDARAQLFVCFPPSMAVRPSQLGC